MDGLILAGDVGGTKTHLGLFKHSAGTLELVRDHRYATADFTSLEAVCADFLGAGATVNAVCVGVPGPIIDGRGHATNVPWELSSALLSRALNGVPVRLLNDLAAIAYGMVHLKPAEFAGLHRAENPPAHGNIAVIAAGTGLGESSLVWEDSENKFYAVASEGGHSDFAPHGAEQIDLLRFLEGEFGHVSYERVLSGPGLTNIYRFLRRESGVEEPAWLRDEIAKGDHAAAVSERRARRTRPGMRSRTRDVLRYLRFRGRQPRAQSPGARRGLSRRRDRAENFADADRRCVREGFFGEGQAERNFETDRGPRLVESGRRPTRRSPLRSGDVVI